MFSVKSSFSCISLNTSALRDSIKRIDFFLFCKSKKSHCIFLQETHSNLDDVKLWMSQRGDKIIFTHASTHSAEMAILLNNVPVKILKVETDSNGHWASVLINIEDVLFYFIQCVWLQQCSPK